MSIGAIKTCILIAIKENMCQIDVPNNGVLLPH